MSIADILEVVSLGPVISLAIWALMHVVGGCVVGYIAFLVVRAALRWANSATGQQVISTVVASRVSGGASNTNSVTVRRIE